MARAGGEEAAGEGRVEGWRNEGASSDDLSGDLAMEGWGARRGRAPSGRSRTVVGKAIGRTI